MTTRCCILCGRWGERAFCQVDDDGGWACQNDRACRRRRDATASDPSLPAACPATSLAHGKRYECRHPSGHLLGHSFVEVAPH